MSRTYRKERGTSKTVPDGQDQYPSRSCRHHGGCSWCERNRLFNFRKVNQEKFYRY